MLNVFFLGLIWPFVCVSYLAKRLNFFQFVHTLGHYLFKCFFLSSSLLCPFSWPLGTLVTCISGCLIFSHSLLMSHFFLALLSLFHLKWFLLSCLLQVHSSLIQPYLVCHSSYPLFFFILAIIIFISRISMCLFHIFHVATYMLNLLSALLNTWNTVIMTVTTFLSTYTIIGGMHRSVSINFSLYDSSFSIPFFFS